MQIQQMLQCIFGPSDVQQPIGQKISLGKNRRQYYHGISVRRRVAQKKT